MIKYWDYKSEYKFLKKKIVVTGGSGRFGKVIKNHTINSKLEFLFPTKKNLNILNINSINKYLIINYEKKNFSYWRDRKIWIHA